MQPPLPAKLQLSPENRYPHYFYMRLQGTPVAPERLEALKSSSTSTDCWPIDLYLSLKFNEQWEPAIGGRIKLGFRGGQLKLSLKNGTISQDSYQLAGSIKLAIQSNKPNQEERKVEGGGKVGLAESQMGTQANLTTEPIPDRSDRLLFTTCQMATKGVEENPIWVFAVEPGKPSLKGFMQNFRLATINITAKPCHVTATFGVSPSDLYLREMDAVWRQKLSLKKNAVVERAIVRHLVQRKLTPYLSRQELRFE